MLGELIEGMLAATVSRRWVITSSSMKLSSSFRLCRNSPFTLANRPGRETRIVSIRHPRCGTQRRGFAGRRSQQLLHHRDALADPTHAGHGHRVPQRAVARAVCRWLLAIGDQRVVVGEALEAFALDGREAAHGHRLSHAVVGARPDRGRRIRDDPQPGAFGCAAVALTGTADAIGADAIGDRRVSLPRLAAAGIERAHDLGDADL